MLAYEHGGRMGIDGGTYLISRDAALGFEHDIIMHARPPLAPGFLLVPFTWLLGDDLGFRIWSVAASICITAGAYYLARGMLPAGQALAVATLVAFDFWTIEQMVNGALPAIALGLLCVVLRSLLDWSLGRASTLGLVAMALALGLIPYVNQSVAGISVVTLPIITAAAAWIRIRSAVPLWDGTPQLAAAITFGFVCALPSWPHYLGVAPGAATVAFGDGISISVTSPNPVHQSLVNLFTAAAWGVIAWGAYAMRSHRGVIFMIVASTLLCVLLIIDVDDEALSNIAWRSKYLLPVTAGILLVMIGMRLPKPWRKPLLGVWCATFAGLCMLSLYKTPAFATEEATVAGARWLSQRADATQVVADEWSLGRYTAPLLLEHGRPMPVLTMRYIAWYYGLDWIPPAFREQTWRAGCWMGFASEMQVDSCEGSGNPPPGTYVISNTEIRKWIFEPIDDRISAAWERAESAGYVRLVWQRDDIEIYEVRGKNGRFEPKSPNAIAVESP